MASAKTKRSFGDVAIFLTSADPPISEGERAFLEEVGSEAVRLFFVLNKVDYLDESDLAEALGFTERVLARALGQDVLVYPVSAKRALEAKLAGDEEALRDSGLAAFERDFHEFLLRDKGRTILASAADQARRVIADLRNSMDVEERAAQLPQREVEER